MPISEVHTLEELEALLAKAEKLLSGKQVALLPIKWSPALEEFPRVEVLDPNLDHLAAAVRPGAHAFYWWDETAVDGNPNEGEKVVLRIALWQDGLLFDWSLITKKWLDYLEANQETEEGSETDQLGRPVPALTPEQEALVESIESDPDAVVEKIVERALSSVPKKDLTVPVHQASLLGEHEAGIRGLPFEIEAAGTANELRGRAAQIIERRLSERIEAAMNELVAAFPSWHKSQGSPRLTKALVRMFVQGNGYKASNLFIDDLRVRLDVGMTKA
jgi:hypothetical protein